MTSAARPQLKGTNYQFQITNKLELSNYEISNGKRFVDQTPLTVHDRSLAISLRTPLPLNVWSFEFGACL